MNAPSAPGGSDDDLVVERHDAALVVRLNRPDARNALSPSLLGGIARAMTDAEADPEVRVVVITGTGDRAFCAGMDLAAFAEGGSAGLGGHDLTGFTRLLQGELTVPVVGAANGTAVGGGLELLMGCDVVVASSEARFGLPEVKRGLYPAGGGTAIGTRIPLGIALEMTLTGDLIDAARAYELGLVNAVTAPAEVMATALTFADRLAANAPLALTAIKELVRLAVSDRDEWSARNEHWQAVVFSSEDAREGASAFIERRPPVWRGK